MASQITSNSTVCSTVFLNSGWHQRKYQSSTSLCEEKPSVIGGFPSRKTVIWNVSASHDVIITILASESQNIQIVNMTPVDKPCIIWDRSKQNNHSNTIITFSFLFFSKLSWTVILLEYIENWWRIYMYDCKQAQRWFRWWSFVLLVPNYCLDQE